MACRRTRCVHAAALLTALMLSRSQCRVFTGSLDGSSSTPFLAAFAFGVNGGSGDAAGSVTLSISSASSVGDVLLLFDDDAWPSAYSEDCMTLLSNPSGFLLPLNESSPVSSPIAERVRPHYWFFTLANAPACSANPSLSYTLTAVQWDGNQLSFDEIGLPALYGAFWAVYILALALHTRTHYLNPDGAFKPALVVFLTACLTLEASSQMFAMLAWALLQRDGVGVPALAILGSSLRVLSLTAVLLSCALTACGYGIASSSVSLAHRRNIIPVTLLALLLAADVAAVVYVAVGVNDSSPSRTLASSWAAVLLLILTIAFGVWFCVRSRATLRQERDAVKRRVLFRLMAVMACHFLVLPLAFIVSAATPAYQRTRVVVGVDLAVITLLFALTNAVLWPSHAAGAFRDTDVENLFGDLTGTRIVYEFAPVDGEDAPGMEDAYATLEYDKRPLMA